MDGDFTIELVQLSDYRFEPHFDNAAVPALPVLGLRVHLCDHRDRFARLGIEMRTGALQKPEVRLLQASVSAQMFFAHANAYPPSTALIAGDTPPEPGTGSTVFFSLSYW